jgi:hypothetical protein
MVAPLWLLAQGGCSGGLDPPTLVNKLRVLAVRSRVEQPPPDGPSRRADAWPGDTVALDALVVGTDLQFDGGAPPSSLSRLWFACQPPPGSTDVKDCATAAAALGQTAAPDCASQPDAAVCIVGTDLVVSLPIPATRPAPSSVFVTLVVATDESGGPLACLTRAGQGQPPGDACVIALKTINVIAPDASGQDLRNQNPPVSSILIQGQDVHTDPPLRLQLGQKVVVQPDFDPDVASEVKICPVPLECAREVLTFSWFATQKDFDHFHSGYSPSPPAERSDNVYTDQGSEPGAVFLWLVVRDDRGGVGWTDGVIQVDPP